MKRLRTTRRAKPKPKAIVAVVSFPGRAKSGSDTEWLLAADDDTARVGLGNDALTIAVEALRLLVREAAQIPTGSSQRDKHFRQWMLDIAVHKAAIACKMPMLSVSMYFLIQKTNEWGATMAETTRQLLKRDMLPRQQEPS